MAYRVCQVQDVPCGEKRSYIIKNIPIVLVHSRKDEFYAIYAICPHQHANLGYGALGGVTQASHAGEDVRVIREGEILRCPWHGFSYDVTTGMCLTAPDTLRVKTYAVTVRNQEVYIEL